MADPIIDEKKIQDAVREKYAQVSRSAAGKFNIPQGEMVQSSKAMIPQSSRVCPMN
jgi:hypothetical protein